jgi:hypothetical protein
MDDLYQQLHKYSFNNQFWISRSKTVGCFFCIKMFPAKDVCEYVPGEKTAMCPYCGIDSLLGDYNVQITQSMLEDMNRVWFSPQINAL